MAQAAKKSKAKSKKNPKGKAMKAQKDSPFSDDEVEAVLKSFHRVLRNKNVTQPVRMQLAGAEGNLCLEWQCQTLDDGSEQCGWVQVPC